MKICKTSVSNSFRRPYNRMTGSTGLIWYYKYHFTPCVRICHSVKTTPRLMLPLIRKWKRATSIEPLPFKNYLNRREAPFYGSVCHRTTGRRFIIFQRKGDVHGKRSKQQRSPCVRELSPAHAPRGSGQRTGASGETVVYREAGERWLPPKAEKKS